MAEKDLENINAAVVSHLPTFAPTVFVLGHLTFSWAKAWGACLYA